MKHIMCTMGSQQLLFQGLKVMGRSLGSRLAPVRDKAPLVSFNVLPSHLVCLACPTWLLIGMVLVVNELWSIMLA